MTVKMKWLRKTKAQSNPKFILKKTRARTCKT
jgi:hypothetical protein